MNKIRQMICRHRGCQLLYAKFILLLCLFTFWLNGVQATEAVPHDANFPVTYFRLDNGLSVPIPASEELFNAQSGGLGFSAIFQGVVDDRNIGIILTMVDNFTIEDVEEPSTYIKEAIRELWGGGSAVNPEILSLKYEFDDSLPEHTYLILFADCLVTYPEFGTQIRTYAGIIVTDSAILFFELFPSMDFSSSLYSFIFAWAKQVGQKLEKYSEGPVDDRNYSESAPYFRTGKTLKDFRIPLPHFNDQNYTVIGEDEHSLQFQHNNIRADEVSVTLLPNDIPYDLYMHEKGNMARRITARDSTGKIYDIHPKKVYDSRYIGCSSWYDPYSENGAINVFFGMVYLDGRVLSIKITAPNGVPLLEVGIEWLTSIFRDNSEMADVLFYDVLKELTE